MPKKLFFTVTNDLTYDQRMQRICSCLAANGYEVTLVGRKLNRSKPLQQQLFRQKRIRCWFNSGKLFYAEYNTRLFFYLLFKHMHLICAIDLDTILPCLYISKLKRITRVYDAHELFSEMKEIVTRPAIKKIWDRVERKAVPQFRHGYTVCESIAEEFTKRYGVQYQVVRNVPVTKKLSPSATEVNNQPKILLYTGAVNEARGFEYLIPALQHINARLVVCGDGNFMPQLKQLINDYQVQDKVTLTGMLLPNELWQHTLSADIGIALCENEGLNQYYSLPNKFFDYIQAGLPQIAMAFPEYERVNKQYRVAVLVDDMSPERLAAQINNLLQDVVLYETLRQNCLEAKHFLNWEVEQKKLISFYKSILHD